MIGTPNITSQNTFTPMVILNGPGYENDGYDYYIKRFNLPIDARLSYREKKLTVLGKFLDGTIYNNLMPFHEEFQNNQYIRLFQRSPSVKYNICKIVVDTSVTMLFGEGHFPTPRCKEDQNTEEFLQYITRKCKLKELMISAAKSGSVGSVCILVKVLEDKFYFESIETKDVTPTFKRLKPDELEELTQKRKLDGSTLRSHGYAIPKDDLNQFFYLIRRITDQEEIFYLPYKCSEERDHDFTPTVDTERTATHSFGFVPAIWIKNLVSASKIDGQCTFDQVLDIQIEIAYQLSQSGRMLHYSGDPTLVIKNPTTLEGNDLIKGIQTLNVDDKGDAYYAEIDGTSSERVLNFVKALRQYGLEVVRGDRSDPDRLTSAQSGKALEMLNLALIGLVCEMRLMYGDSGLIPLYVMIIKICNLPGYNIKYKKMPSNNEDIEDSLILDWPDWYPQSSSEKLQEAQALTTYTEGGILSKETALKSVADEYNVLSEQKELKAIEKEKKEDYDIVNNSMKNNGVIDKSISGGATKPKSSGA